jgi:hypothetical protein
VAERVLVVPPKLAQQHELGVHQGEGFQNAGSPRERSAIALS